MFKRTDEVETFTNYLEKFILAVIVHTQLPDTAPSLNRKRQDLENYIAELASIADIEPEVYLCPDCGSEMVERKNREKGTKFYGCKKYPNCKGTRDSDGLSKAERDEKKYKTDETYPQDNGFSFNKKRNLDDKLGNPPVEAKIGWVNPFKK